MSNCLIRFDGHIRTERYALNYTTEADLRRGYQCYINPSAITAIEQRTDSAFDAQQVMFVSAKHYCKIWTVNGVFEVDGTLQSVTDRIASNSNFDIL